ncbi:5365_t:CDS:2 [Cetraspora pellucida]|uniref:5365_t:CDS:1 n=1 Tax=Cetraspora pellucida TaxID=1433469 RepID=A0A9N9FX93_9GLOM|nr:5365_t:CDS:2 [Cetraspora pellucida]
MTDLVDDTTYISSFETITSTWFLAVSLALTADSFLRAIVDKTIDANYWYLIPVNISLLANEILMLFLVRASQICSSDTINLNNNCTYTANVSFSKCSDDSSRAASVSETFGCFISRLIAWFFIVARIVEVSLTTTFFFIDGFKCQGSYCGPLCWLIYNKIYYVRDIVAPFFRIYYIIAETFFYWCLFKRTLELRKDKNIRRVIFHQTFLFTIDIAQLLAIMTYREIGRFDHQLPTYIYAELFSTAFTVFVMTKFIDKIPVLHAANINDVNGNAELAKSPISN